MSSIVVHPAFPVQGGWATEKEGVLVNKEKHAPEGNRVMASSQSVLYS